MQKRTGFIINCGIRIRSFFAYRSESSSFTRSGARNAFIPNKHEIFAFLLDCSRVSERTPVTEYSMPNCIKHSSSTDHCNRQFGQYREYKVTHAGIVRPQIVDRRTERSRQSHDHQFRNAEKTRALRRNDTSVTDFVFQKIIVGLFLVLSSDVLLSGGSTSNEQ